MDAFKRFSLVAMATIIAAGAAPVFAQDTRDTRPERPKVEQGGSDSSRIGEPFFVNPPKRHVVSGFHETLGVTCQTYWWHAKNHDWIEFTNNGMKTIPKGTVFTWIMKPSGEIGTWTVPEDIKPGERIKLWHVLVGTNADHVDCDVTLKSDKPIEAEIDPSKLP